MSPKPIDPSTLLPNPGTRNGTLEQIHSAYQVAVGNSDTSLEIPLKFHDVLSSIQHDIPLEDKHFFFKFMAGVNTCHKERKSTFQVNNFLTMLNILVCYIICWINTTPEILKKTLPSVMFNFDKGFGFDYDAFLILRRKALESDLFKILKRSLRIDHYTRNLDSYPSIGEFSATIRDRFGFLCIIQNDFADKNEERNAIDALRMVLNGILCEQDPGLRSEFIAWLKTFNSLDCMMCEILLEKYSFSVGHFKDYVRFPKGKYETQQWTFKVEHSSMDHGGLEFEFQLRTKRMHKNATDPSSSAAHTRHKDNFDATEFKGLDIELLKRIIFIDDFDSINISGLSKYPSASSITIGLSTDNLIPLDPHEITNDWDIDGVYLPKLICSRRVSKQLVYLVA